MSIENPISTENSIQAMIVETFTPKQKEQWEMIKSFFENGRTITMASLDDPVKNTTEASIWCLDDGFKDTIIMGTFKRGETKTFRTPEEKENNQDNYTTIALAAIANGSAQINVKLYNS